MISSNLFFYIICGILFILLCIGMTISQTKRQWLNVLILISSVIGIGLIIIFEDPLGSTVSLKNFSFFILVITLPQVISPILRRNRQIVFKANLRLDWLSAIGIFFILLGVLAFYVLSREGETLFAKILSFISGISYSTFLIVIIYRPTTIFIDGILFKNLFWSWKDIQNYRFIGNISEKSLAKLISPNQEFFTEVIFYPKKMPIWNPYKEITIVIPEKNFEVLSVFLEQHLSRLEGHSKV